MRQTQGFTLVELSIVLVILGLLVGGVLSGQSLIRAAELRAITTEKDKYVVALNAFRDKYFARPGDMKNAFAFWGTDCGTDTNDLNDGCNGNGDGKIEYDANGENVKAWEHLSRAGLIEGNFDGTGTDAGSGTSVYVSPENLPASKFSGAFWAIDTDPINAAGTATGGHYLHLGSARGVVANVEWLQLTHGEAWNIDTKVDDGRANTGNLRGDAYDTCDDAGTDYYQIAAQGPDRVGDCALHFVLR